MFVELNLKKDGKRMVKLDQICEISENADGSTIISCVQTTHYDTRPYESIKQLLTDKGLML